MSQAEAQPEPVEMAAPVELKEEDKEPVVQEEQHAELIKDSTMTSVQIEEVPIVQAAEPEPKKKEETKTHVPLFMVPYNPQ